MWTIIQDTEKRTKNIERRNNNTDEIPQATDKKVYIKKLIRRKIKQSLSPFKVQKQNKTKLIGTRHSRPIQYRVYESSKKNVFIIGTR